MEALEKQRDAAEKKLADLKVATGKAWEDMKTGMDKALEDLKKTYKETSGEKQ
jgi:hypothetical protein